MEYRLRKEVDNAKRAVMGEMFRLAKENLKTGDKLINFASGHPSEEVFSSKIIKRGMDSALDEAEKDIFQYGPHAGYMPLRQMLKKFVNERGNIAKPEDDLMITYGAVEAVSLTLSAFVSQGDKVIAEVPSYVNAIKAFQIQGAEVIGVPMEKDGVNLEKLEEAMKQGAKLFYTMPNFSNPSGITTSLQKRKAVYDLAVKYQVIILEDNVYGELRYRGQRIPDIKEFDVEGIVVYVSSVSKWLVPAMRVGFMVANKELIKRILPVKAVSSNGVTAILQYALLKILEENDIYGHIDQICSLYAKKILCMKECMDEYFPEGVRRSDPDGGMYIWATLPEGADALSFCSELAMKLHIAVTPGDEFCMAKAGQCTGMRFNFVKESMEDIRYGIERTGDFMARYLV